MTPPSQNAFAAVWNWYADRRSRRLEERLVLGQARTVTFGKHPTIGIPMHLRREHIGVLGKTGSGKTSLMRYLCLQDIARGHGFAFFDLHGDTTPFLLGAIADQERKSREDLSSRTILIDPNDPGRSVGINLLDTSSTQDAFVEIAEITALLRHRWKLDTLGVRTEELLRHSLFVLISNGLTLLEITPLLTNAGLRKRWVRRTPRGEARTFFEARFERLSEEMQSVYREAILNKVSLYAADPRFRHLLGQSKSTINLKAAIDSGYWILVNLEKGRLGDEAATLGALLLSKIKHAVLGRNTRRLFTLYCDELQNLVAYDAGLDVLLSEARKFGVSVISANQYLDQYSTAMRAAILAMGTQVFFRLSGLDAQRIAYWLGKGRFAADRMRVLNERLALVRTPEYDLEEIAVPEIRRPNVSPLDLLRRVRDRWTQERSEIDRAILERHGGGSLVPNERLTGEWQ